MDGHRLGVAAMTDCEFLLEVLSDGEPHTLNEILARSFRERGHGLTVHSRAPDLRRLGHVVKNTKDGSRSRGNSSVYQLLSSLDPATSTAAGARVAGSSEGVTASGTDSPGLTANASPSSGTPPLDFSEEPRRVEAPVHVASPSGSASSASEPSSEPIPGQLQIGEAA